MKIRTGTYANPDAVGGWTGWIEPADKSWIVFVDTAGKPHLYPKRDRKGGVIGGEARS